MKKNSYRLVLCLMFFAWFAGCKELPNPFEGERVLARAGKETLRQMDVEKVFPGGIAGADSVKWVESYVDRWVRDNLKLYEARRLFGENAADEELVQAYRNSLMLRRLEQHFIENAPSGDLYTEKELRDYYNTHKGDFILDRSIVRGRVVGFPSDFRQKSRLRELFAGPSSADNRAELEAMVGKNRFVFHDAGDWTEYPSFLAMLPTRRSESYDHFLSRSGIQEMTDGDTTWWFVISDARTPGSSAPYEMVDAMVRFAVSARRKKEIVRTAEDSIFRIAILEKKAVVNL